MKTIALSSFKGGTGKSSLAVLLGNTFAASGRKVLLIDLDHQKNTTHYHATDLEAILDQNIAEAFHRGTLSPNILASHIPNIDFVAGSFGILKLRAASIRTLSRLLEPEKETYDVALIDCPPTLDNIVLNAWQAADFILTPARLDGFDLEGVGAFGAALTQEMPEKHDCWQIVLNFYRSPRGVSPDSVAIQLENTFAERYCNLSKVRIPETVAIWKAVHDGETISASQRTAKVYEAFLALASEVAGAPVVPERGII